LQNVLHKNLRLDGERMNLIASIQFWLRYGWRRMRHGHDAALSMMERDVLAEQLKRTSPEQYEAAMREIEQIRQEDRAQQKRQRDR
jgi:hypothetical protein